MDQQFIFFCTNIGNEQFLKEEIRVFYPELLFSYSRKGFITFKNTGVQYDTKTISQLQVAFATRAGICLGKSAPSDLKVNLASFLTNAGLSEDKCLFHCFSINTDYELETKDIIDSQVNEFSAINKTVINLIALGEKEIWVGVHSVGKNTTNYPNSNPEIEIPIDSPSIGYLKLAQTTKLFNIPMNSREGWLDFGSAPGGTSHFILSHGCRVWGVDPAMMDENIMKNSRYTHHRSSAQNLSHENLTDRHNIQWVNVDMNINPKQSIKEILRLCKKFNDNLKGIIFNIPVVKKENIELIEEFEDMFYEWGFGNVTSRQIPSHKKEYVIVAKR